MITKEDKLESLYESMDHQAFMELKADLEDINRDACEEQLSELPKIFGNIAVLANIAESKYAREVDEFEHWKSVTRFEFTEERLKTGEKVTATIIDDFVNSRPEFLEKRKVILNHKQKRDLFKTLLQLLNIKRDALIQVNSTKRAESKIY